MTSIAGKKTGNIFALTPTQEGLLFHYLKNPSTEAYFEQLSLELKGPVDKGYFEKAWIYVADTNEMLRTSFRWEKLQSPVQLVSQEPAVDIEFHDLSTPPGRPDKEARWEKVKQEDRLKPFDLRRVPFRVKLGKLEEDRWGMIISFHHILLDGWSTGIIIKEFLAAYHRLAGGRSLNDRLIKPSFSEFIKYRQGQDREKQKTFWQDYLWGYHTLTDLPFKKKPAEGTPLKAAVGRTRSVLTEELKPGLDRLSREQGITPAAFFYGAWGILVQRYCDSGDVVFGAVVSGRSAPIKGIEGIVGLFINTLPIRVKSGPGTTIMDLLKSLRDILPVFKEYETTPLVDIKKYSPLEGTEELFDSLVAIENYPLGKNLEPGNTLITIESPSMWESTHYDMNVAVAPGDIVIVDFIYAAEKFREETVERMVGHFRNITEEMIGNPLKRVHEIDMLSEFEKQKLIYEFNAVGAEYPRGKTIHVLFEEQVRHHPDHIAVTGRKSPGRTLGLTYRELNESANRLAFRLRAQGAHRDTLVGLMVEPCPQVMVGIIGILKAGGAYLPINPNLPGGRVEYILKDSVISILISFNHAASHVVFTGVVIHLETLETGDSLREKMGNPGFESHPRDLAYVIYTSGSTGRPKGTVVEHSQLVNFLYHMYRRYNQEVDFHDRCLGLTNMMFDVSVWEFFLPIVFGAQLVLLPERHRFDVFALAHTILEEKITLIYLPPGLLKDIHEHLENQRSRVKLNKMLVGVEPIRDEVLEAYLRLNPSMKIINGYGPTETTICATSYNYYSHEPQGEIVPIGTPLSNNRVLLLDGSDHIVPQEIPGEICISGDGVSRGYLNNPELTAAKYIPHPYFPSDRMYRTGDLGRILPGGHIRFVGRRDQQVKIRGFRIELGEIENQILEHDGVRAAVVTVQQRSTQNTHSTQENFLCAYVVFQPGQATDPLHGLREFLAQRLPDYMVPSYFIEVETIPLNPNGKVDLKKLPVPAIISSKTYAAPGTPMEKTLADIWSRVLGMDKNRIGIDDDFFELGGHSLRVTRLTGLIYKELQVEIPFTEVFLNPTVREQGQWIARQKKNRYSPILPVEEKEYYPASAAQKRLFVLHRMTGDSIAYNIHGVMEVEGSLAEEKFRETVRRLVERHAGLRTSFLVLGGEVVQRIHSVVPDPAAVISGPGGSVDSIIKQFIQPFDLAQAPLLRVGLVKREECLLLILDMHHIISDGMSMRVVIKEFISLYGGENPGKPVLRYHDFSEGQKNVHHTDIMKGQEAYWLRRFIGGAPLLHLPWDYSRPVAQVYEGAHLHFQWDDKVVKELHRAAREGNTTWFGVLLAVFNILLSKLSGQEDIVVGTPAAGRRHPDLPGVVGMFVNTLALRVAPKGNKKTRDFIKEVGECIVEGFENQEYPFDNLVEKVALHRDAGHHPLFDVMFAMQNMELPEIHIPGLNFKPHPYDDGIAKFDLVFICEGENKSGGLDFTVEFCTQLFKADTIARFIDYFKKVQEGVSRDKDIPIGEIEIISPKEKEEILYGFNHLERVFEGGMTLPGLFRSQVLKSPDNVALWGHSLVRDDDKPIRLSYGELDRGSDRLAFILRGIGIKTGDIVGIMVTKSLEMIEGILGILKTGAAYLPINPKNPAERTRYMLKDSGAKLLVTANNIEGTFLNSDLPNFLTSQPPNFSLLPATGNRPPVIPHPTILTPLTQPTHQNLAYIIYTSGSTGIPKGVPITHADISPLLHWGYDYLGIGLGERGLQNLAFYFDWSVWEIFIHLTGGAGLYMLKEEALSDPAACTAFIETQALTVLHATPTQFHYLARVSKKLNSLRFLCLGAEKLTYDLVERSLEMVDEKCRVFNMYGPTEATIISAVLEVDRRDYRRFKSLTSVPIGEPVGNLLLLILDHYFNMCPVGIPGELYITGQGVAAGYLNNPTLTSERFFTHELHELSRITKSFKGVQGGVFQKAPLLYKTGDLSRWLDDGNVEFLGRMDHQVKIRGYRIELGEIENRLLEHKNIKAAVVIDRETGDNDRYLCAYYVPVDEGGVLELKKFLAQQLPDYMVPSYFIPLTKIPLNANGKVDLKALPEPGAGFESPGKVYVAPRPGGEQKLAEIWAEVLRIPKTAKPVGIDDNFFEIGGHSLNAALMVSYIHKAFNVDVPLKEIFVTPYIRGLAEYIGTLPGGHYAPLEPVEEKAYYVLSPGQRRLFLLQQMDKETTAYNIPSVWELDGEPDPDRIERVFRELIARHESLRTSFRWVGDEPVQVIHPKVRFSLEYYPIPSEIGDESRFPGPIRLPQGWNRAFDLSQAPLMRAGLLKIHENRLLLLLDLHHIVSDGMSMGVFTRDFMDMYAGKELLGPQYRYRDYTQWQRSEKEILRLSEQCKYWLKEFQGAIPVLELPLDYARPAEQRFEGDRLEQEIDSETWWSLKTLAADTRTTPYMVLLTIYTIFLSKITGQEDIVVGTPAAARKHPSLNSMIGMFVNTLALRNFPSGEKRFSHYLEEIKERSLSAFENQEYPFEELVEKLAVERNINRNPLFDTMLILQNTGGQEISIPGLKISPQEFENKTSKFDITLTGVEGEKKLAITWEYSTALFTADTIKRFIGYFINLVSCIIENREKRIQDLEIASEEEKERILSRFNQAEPEYPQEKTIQGFFAEQVRRTPDRMAVIGGSVGDCFKWTVHLTYREVDVNTEGLAALLRRKGVVPGNIVAVQVDRSLEMVTGILGILKAGAGYLPVLPQNPEVRTQFMLKDSGAKVLVTTGSATHLGAVRELPLQSIALENALPTSILTSTCQVRTERAGTGHCPVPTYSPAAGNWQPATSLAYVIYTSGSTGNPKGVVVKQTSVVNLLCALQGQYPFSEQETYLLKTPYIFDVSVSELFGWYMGGGRLAILEPGGEKDPRFMVEAIEKYRVTHINFVPSMFTSFVEYLGGEYHGKGNKDRITVLKYIFLAGEALLPGLVKRFTVLGTGVRLENLYGPTEAAVYASLYSLSDWNGEGSIPIGKPLTNVNLYILDKGYRLQPVGIPGELFIGGVGVAMGYLNNPTLTSEKFLMPDWSDRSDKSDKADSTYKLYRTGDRVRWREDGNIEYFGRIDQQVKIRGFRIELGEIENRLMAHPQVKDAVVVAREKEDRSGEKLLCAYVVMASGVVLNVSAVREYLSGYLPEYMVPSYFVPLGSIPLNSSGKVDIRALPLVEGVRPRLGREYIAPLGRLEQVIAGIWAELLKLDKIGVEDNFFDLGGTSLDIVRVGNRLKEILNKDISTMILFKFPTVRALSRHLEPGEVLVNLQEESKIKQREKLDKAKAMKKEMAARLMKKK